MKSGMSKENHDSAFKKFTHVIIQLQLHKSRISFSPWKVTKTVEMVLTLYV